MKFTNASLVFPVLCCRKAVGARGAKGYVPPSFWQISRPYINQESRLCSAHYCMPPWIFRPSDGPASDRHGTHDLYARFVRTLHCDQFGFLLFVNFTKLKSEFSNIYILKTGSDKMSIDRFC